jgi:succinate dehydrogenase / fumarate reductase cytochrome b subunit
MEEIKATGSQSAHLPNRLGIKGWIWGGNYTLERYLYTLHRLTGLGLLLYITMHLAANGVRLGGVESWEDLMSVLGMSGFKVGEYLVMAAFVIHALNGGRLIVQHLGYTLGKPKPPIYPYVDSMRRKRPITWLMLVGVAALLIYVLVVFVT